MISLTESFKNAFFNTFIVLGSLLSILVLEGFLLGLLRNKSINYLRGAFGYSIIILSGLGIFIHELGHMIMAFIFSHKINDFQLFPSFNQRSNGTLGYVNHSYNPKNLYQVVGCFFIGIGPIILGTLTLIGSIYLLLPNAFSEMVKGIHSIQNTVYLSKDFFTSQFSLSFELIKNIFTSSNLTNIYFWIFIFISTSISLHISLSKSDLQNTVQGVLVIFIITFVANFLISLINIDFKFTLLNLSLYNIYLFTFFNIALLFSIIGLLVSFVLSRVIETFISK